MGRRAEVTMIICHSHPGTPGGVPRLRSGTRRLAIAAAAAAAGLAGLTPACAASRAVRPAAAGRPAAAVTRTTPTPAQPGWRTVFSDRFAGRAGARVDRRWTYDLGTAYRGSGCAPHWGTGEVETDTAAKGNVRLDGHGHLLIRPLRPAGGWTSGRIETTGSGFAAPAGGELRVTATIRQPGPVRGLGYWPAFWMLGARFRSAGAGTSGTMACSRSTMTE